MSQIADSVEEEICTRLFLSSLRPDSKFIYSAFIKLRISGLQNWNMFVFFPLHSYVHSPNSVTFPQDVSRELCANDFST